MEFPIEFGPRILAASAEVLSTDSELRFPDRIAPFSACVIAPKSGSKEEAAAGDAVTDLYDDLGCNSTDILDIR